MQASLMSLRIPSTEARRTIRTVCAPALLERTWTRSPKNRTTHRPFNTSSTSSKRTAPTTRCWAICRKAIGDKSLTLFGENITPNLHKLAGEYILYDNFYVNADVSAEGHNWSSAAIAPDYTVKMWPNSYAGRRKTYDYEGGEPANLPPAGYIWTNALAAGSAFAVYGIGIQSAGDQVRRIAADRHSERSRSATVRGHGFSRVRSGLPRHGYRAKEFLREWKDFEEKGEAPQLIVMRIPNDHTAGGAGETDSAVIRG